MMESIIKLVIWHDHKNYSSSNASVLVGTRNYSEHINKDIDEILDVDSMIHDPATNGVEFDRGFWNILEVGFLNHKDVDDLNPTQVNFTEGIKLIVDLNPSDEAKDTGKGKWKQKSINDILGINRKK